MFSGGIRSNHRTFCNPFNLSMHDSTPDKRPAQRHPQSWLQRVGITRALLAALVLSIGLHGAFVGFLHLAAYLEMPFMMRFEQSAGIGVMSRIGRQLASDQQHGAPRYTRIVDLTPPPQPAGPQAPTDAERAEMERAKEDAQKRAEEARAQAEKEQAEKEAKEAQERRARRKAREEEAKKSAEDNNASRRDQTKDDDAHARNTSTNDAGQDDETARDTTQDGDDTANADNAHTGDAHASSNDPDAGPQHDLPPAERYPEGTINPVATDLGMWGPEGARLVVVVRHDRLRNSPHAQSVRDVLDSFPDWRTLIGGASLDPLTDVDTTLIASANPRYINQTFLAAMHQIPAEKVIGLLSQGAHQGVTWREEKGRLIGDFEERSGHDPRQFFIPTDGVFVLSRPEFMKDLERQAPTPQGLDAAKELAQLPKDQQQQALAKNEWKQDAPSARKPRRKPPTKDAGWLRGIMDVADYGGTQRNGPAAMVSTGKISNMKINGYRGTMPQSMHANIYAERDVRVTGRMLFSKQKEAEALQDAWDDVLKANRGSLNLTGLYKPLRDANLEIDHNELTFDFTIPQSTMKRLGVSISQLMEMR